MDFVLELKEDEQEAPEMNPHYGMYEQNPKYTLDYNNVW